MSLSLPQRLLLTRFLTDALAALRRDGLLPEAQAEMVTGERAPVKFGGRLAGWVTMPKPSKKAAYVSDEGKLLAWAEREHPGKVTGATAVAVDDDLIAFLAEHYPSALRTTRQVDPQWVADITQSLRDHGHYITAEGEKLTEVPGITLPEPDPASPRVTLEDGAGAVIMAAWRDGTIPVADLLALPAGEATG